MLVGGRPHWPALRLVAEFGDPPPAAERLTGERAELNLKTGGRLTVDRRQATARYQVPRALSKEELVHPFLAPAAAVVAHWLGRLAFHAGAFVSDGGVWALVGAREAGKSSTLAWLASIDHQVVADDVLVLEDGSAFAGPRSIDLREDTADRLQAGRALGVIGARHRWRVTLPQIPPALPFRGWVFLDWGGGIDARRLSGSECLTRLVQNLTLHVSSTNPAALLELAGLPAWELRRPAEWSLMSESVERLLQLTRSP